MRAIPAAVAVLILTLAGCGGDGDGAQKPVETTELRVTLDVDGDGDGPAQVAEFSCPGADAPPNVCEAVDDLPDNAAAPIGADVPCTEIYGGPDVVILEGTIRGEPVDAELTRANGCEIERFERFLGLLEALFPDYEPGSALVP